MFTSQAVLASKHLPQHQLRNVDFQGLLARQSRYVQAQMRNYDLQAQELGRLVAGNPHGLQATA